MIPFDKVGDVLYEFESLTKFVIIGDTIVDVLLKRKGTESDIDLFVLDISVLVDDDKIRNFAYDKGWDYGRTPIDTPRLLVPVNDDQLQIDLYENIQDFFVPKEILDSAINIKIGNHEFKSVTLEDYILLKANAFREEDEDELRTLIYLLGEGKIKIDKEYLKKHLNAFEENSDSIRERLSLIGIKI
ncbi:nucleotidyltransferase [Sulfolobus tengchongensis]|uniref:Nucleotidyltransferase n=1 Tax=Sulfolobus tengchongensis TaxID=207809 RepID=A0AAX4L1A0_9CREN